MSRSGRYSKIERKMWGDARFLRLSRAQPSGQFLWVYLLTGPHNTVIPGLFVLSVGSIADKLGWKREAVNGCFKQIVDSKMAEYDPKTGLVWLKNAIKYNQPASPNVVIGWMSTWHELPECPLREEARVKIAAAMKAISKPFFDAFEACCLGVNTAKSTNPSGVGKPKTRPKPSVEASAEPQPEASAEPQPEASAEPQPEASPTASPAASVNQEQEQEQKQDPPRTPPSRPTAPPAWSIAEDAKQAVVRGVGGRINFHLGLSTTSELQFKRSLEAWEAGGVDVASRMEVFGRWLVSGGQDGRGGLSWVKRMVPTLEWVISSGKLEQYVGESEEWARAASEREAEEGRRKRRAEERASAPTPPRDPNFFLELRSKSIDRATDPGAAGRGEEGR